MILFMFVAGSLGSSHAHIDTTTYKTLTDSVFVIGDRILVRDIVFSQPGGSKLLDKSFNCLDSVGLFLVQNPSLKVEIAFHSDGRGSKDFALKSTAKQGESVMKSLLQRNAIYANRLTSKGYGSSEPIIPALQISHETEKHAIEKLHQINRRMELRVIGFWDDCSDVSFLKSSFSILNWPHESRGTFSKSDSASIQILCACELKDFEFVVFNRWGKIVNQSALKLEESNSENSGFLHSFQIQTATLQSGTYVYYIRKLGSDKTEDVLIQGHFNLVE
jgi:hypothetical protein